MKIGLLLNISFAPHRQILRGIRRYVEAHPDWVLTSVATEHLEKHLARSSGLDGMIAAVTSRRTLEALSSWRRPVVSIQGILPCNMLPRVGVDNICCGRLAAEHFLSIGLRSFAFVGPADVVFSVERRLAFCTAVAEAGFTASSYENRVRRPYDALGQRWDLNDSVEPWLKKLPKPVGVFAANDLWGLQLGEACRRAGLRVPEDVALLGVGNDEHFCEVSRPPLSSIAFQAERIGYDAAGLLSALCRGAPRPRQPMLFPPTEVVARKSSDILAIDDEVVARAIRYLRENFDQPAAIDEVLRQASVGRRTLERRFRKFIGRGVADEIRHLRLKRACRLLIDTDFPMKQIALRSGFSGSRHLSEAFRIAMKVPPTTYRADMRQQAHSSIPAIGANPSSIKDSDSPRGRQ